MFLLLKMPLFFKNFDKIACENFDNDLEKYAKMSQKVIQKND